MLVPLKSIPFNLVIESMAYKKVLPFDKNNSGHIQVLELVKKAAIRAGTQINEKGILRKRANEVGNDIEKFVKNALNYFDLQCEIPKNRSGKKKSTGYPDLIFWFNKKPFYLECKSYNLANIETTQRSFYFSPSPDFKVIYNAIHLMVSYEVFVSESLGEKNIYKCKHFKILTLESLPVDVKYEFNSNNKRLYGHSNGAKVLVEIDLN